MIKHSIQGWQHGTLNPHSSAVRWKTRQVFQGQCSLHGDCSLCMTHCTDHRERLASAFTGKLHFKFQLKVHWDWQLRLEVQVLT